MFDELILAVVAHAARVAPVGLLVGVASLVVIAIANRGESLAAVLALVGLFARVDPHVHQKVPALVELLVAVGALVVGNRLLLGEH